ncbi:MAG: methyltransferase domain-containing protein [Afipia sp.]
MSQCRFCRKPLTRTFIDLGLQPLANSYRRFDQLQFTEPRYPLHAKVCESCFLVQVDHDVPPDAIFSDYAYFSSYSPSWVEHARHYAKAMISRFALHENSLVVEIASNDGYLLQHFGTAGIGVLGIEPAGNVAKEAEARGIKTEVAFFNRDTAARLRAAGVQADLMAANNVLAHVPDINEFVSGFPLILSDQGVLTVEFPHLLNLIEQTQFDTIYHEHYSYLSLLACERIFGAHGMRVFDVEELPTHGGSLRLFVCHNSADHKPAEGLTRVRQKEKWAGIGDLATYGGFNARAEEIRDELKDFLRDTKEENLNVAAYGAAAKGNTLLNYCGINTDLISVVFDKNPHKQNHYLPGSQIPIKSPDLITHTKPDVLLILPWNLRDEIMAEQSTLKGWGGRFVTAIPRLNIF